MTFCFSFEVFVTLDPIQVNIKGGGPTYYTQEGGGLKTVLYLLDIGSYSADLSTAVLSYYKLVKDLIGKK